MNNFFKPKTQEEKDIKELKTKKSVLVAMPCYSGYMPTLMASSLLQMYKTLPCAFLIVDRQRIDTCRNFFVKQMLAGDFDYLFMIDDDNPVPANILQQFIEDDKDIVIPPILSRNPNPDGVYTLCAYYSYDRMVKTKSIKMYEHIKEFRDEGPLHKIDAGGTGAMLIKRKVLEKLSKDYENPFEFGDITIEGQRRTTSEDVEFSERAIKAGFEIWLDERVVPVHLGSNQIIKYNSYGTMGSNNSGG